MEIKEQLPAKQKRRSLYIRAKLILGFSLHSAFISFSTARGIYTNLREQITSEFSTIFVNQCILVFFVALGIGIFAGYLPDDQLAARGSTIFDVLVSPDPSAPTVANSSVVAQARTR